MDPQQQQSQLPPPPPAPSSPSQQPQQQQQLHQHQQPQPQQQQQPQYPMQMQPQQYMPRYPPNQQRPMYMYPVQQPQYPQMQYAPQMYMPYPGPGRGGMVYRQPPQPGQPFIPPPQPVVQAPHVPQQPVVPQQPQAQQQSSMPPQPYQKRERKPLLILDPVTKAAVEVSRVVSQPVVQPQPQQPVQQPPRTQTQPSAPTAASAAAPAHHADAGGVSELSPAEQMRLKALAARSRDPSPSLAAVTTKLEGLKLDQMPEVQLPGPRTVPNVQSQSGHAPIPPISAQQPQPTGIRRDAPNAQSNAPPPLVLSTPPSNTSGFPPVISPAATTTTPMSVAAAEDRKASAKKNWEEKMQKKEEVEQKQKEEDARREEEAKREEEANKRKGTSQPPAPLTFAGKAAIGTGEPNPQISLPLPTPAVPAMQQISPSNSGRSDKRIVYNKDDLLAFRGFDACQRPPPDLHPDFQDYQPRARQRVGTSSRPRDGGVVGGPPRVAGAPPQVGAPDWRNKPLAQQGSAPANVVPPLKVSSNAWKRTQPTSEHEGAMRRVKAILNKLAKDNFDSLSRQVLEIPMTSLTMLEDVIREIFDKALMEPSFGPVYAQLCKDISEKSGGEWDFVSAVQKENGWFWASSTDLNAENCLNGPDNNNGDVGFKSEQEAMDAAKRATAFKRQLLNTCQTEFEKNSYKEIDEEEKQLKETADMNTEESKQKLQQIEAKRRKIKKRVLGNISFIGELFLKKMLSAKIINTCIVGLLGDEAIQSPDTYFDPEKKNEVVPEDIECICKLFQTAGKEMDIGEQNVQTMDRYFRFLAALERHLAKSDKPELRTSRHRFMVKDIIELRQNRWQEKRETLKVSTKEEVRQKQAEQEVSRPFQGGGAGGGRGGGYNAQPAGRNAAPPPSGRFQQNAQAAGGGNIRAVPQSNRFSQPSTTSRSQPGLVGPIKVGGSVQQTVPRVAGGGTAAPTAKPLQVGVPSASSPSPAPSPATGGNATREALTEDKLKQSFHSALDEFLLNQNSGDLEEEIRSLCGRFDNAQAKKILVTLMIERVIEKKDTERQALIKLLGAFVTELNVLDSKSVVEALKDYLEFLNDIVIDSPKAGLHLAQLLHQCTESGALTLEQISECLEKLRQESPEGAEQFTTELKQAFGDKSTKLDQVLGGEKWTAS